MKKHKQIKLDFFNGGVPLDSSYLIILSVIITSVAILITEIIIDVVKIKHYKSYLKLNRIKNPFDPRGRNRKK